MSAQALLEHEELADRAELRITEAEELWKPRNIAGAERFQQLARSVRQTFLPFVRHFIATLCWVRKNVRVTRSVKRMRISESVGLGDKRIVALLEIDGQSFLIGASSNSVSLLAEMKPNPSTSDFRQILCHQQEISS